jgi:very-short-patch-repair endonuclease
MEQELAIKLQENGIHYQRQVEIPVTTADFYFSTEFRPLIVFVDGRVHLGKSRFVKDEELRSLLRKRGYRVLELYYNSYSDRQRDRLYDEILSSLIISAPLGVQEL